MKKEKKKTKISNSVYYIVLATLFLILIGIIILVCLNSYPKMDENEMIKVSNYLKSNSQFYEGMHQQLTENNTISINDISDLDKNKLVAAYLITEGNASDKYDYNNCKECYDLYSKYDNIYFYNPDDVEEISKTLFGENIKKINQNDQLGYNTLFYNKSINMYYMNIIYLNDYANSIFELKEYKQEKNYIYFDYYYGKLQFNNDSITITKLDGFPLVSNIEKKDLFENETSPLNYQIYKDNYQVIRYIFKYNKKIKDYALDSIKIIYDGKMFESNISLPVIDAVEEDS